MTEKRYCDGTLAKWYYSRNNVISDGTNEYYLGSKESIRDWNYDDLLGTNDLLDELNRLSDENEKLKTQLMENNCDEFKGDDLKTEKQFPCENYGLNCLKCSYWNKWSRYCTKWKIWSESHD